MIFGRIGDRRDACPTLLDHPVGRQLGKKIGALDVDVDEAVKALLAGFEDVGPHLWRHPGVVHQQIQPPQLLLRELDQPLAVGAAGNIRLADLGADSLSGNPRSRNAVGRRLLGCGRIAARS